MRIRPALGACLFAFLVVAAPAPAVRAADERAVQQVREQAARIEKTIEEIRDLRFKHTVKVGIRERSELRSYILKELEKEMPDAKIRALEKAYAKFGFLKPGFDLKQTLVELYTEQIAGFYDPEAKELYLVEHGGPEQSVLMAHELTHALQDQNFGLFAMQKAVEHNDDRSLALTSLIEGDATLVMVAYLLDEQIGRRIDVRSLPDIGMILKFSVKLGDIFGMSSGEQFAKAPKVLTENLIFGYVEGASFCQRLVKNQGAYLALSRAFRDPPQSSEQILHPEKYSGEARDEPMAVELPELAKELGPGWKRLERNVMGEFNIALLFKEKLSGGNAERAARGWGGDTWEALEAPDGEVCLIWATVWDTEKDADEFRETYESFAKKRDGPTQVYLTTFKETGSKSVVVLDGRALQKHRFAARPRELVSMMTVTKGYPPAPAIAEKPREGPKKEKPMEEPGPVERPKPPEAPEGTSVPFADVRPPDGFVPATLPYEGPYRAWSGPNGAMLAILESPAVSDDLKAVVERAVDRLKAEGKKASLFKLRYFLRKMPGGARMGIVRYEIIAAEGEPPATHVQAYVLASGTRYVLELSGPSDSFRSAIRAACEANPWLEAVFAPPNEAELPPPIPPKRKKDPTLF